MRSGKTNWASHSNGRDQEMDMLFDCLYVRGLHQMHTARLAESTVTDPRRLRRDLQMKLTGDFQKNISDYYLYRDGGDYKLERLS